MLLVMGSIRTTLLPLGTATQSAPDVTARLMCSKQQVRLGPTRIVATTRSVAGSMRETLGPPALATQTAPGVSARPAGCGPTWIIAVSLFVAGPMRATSSSDG